MSPTRVNPFFSKSPLPYEAPPFDRFSDDDYLPALDEGMRQHRAEVAAIAGQTDAPTFDNTIVALERTGTLLTRVASVFYSLTKSNTNDALQRIEEQIAPRMAAHSDAIHLDAELFARVRAVYEARESLDGEGRYLVERYHRNFIRAGAELSETDQHELRALNQEESSLRTAFGNHLLAATRAGAMVVDDAKALDGLSEGDLAAAAEAARGRGLEGVWLIPLQNTTQHSAQVALAHRETRERLFRASTNRTERGDANDTRAGVQRLAALRALKATLLGFDSYAAYVLDDQMAGTPARAIELLTRVAPIAVRKAGDEARAMQSLLSQQGSSATLAPWDWQHYAEKVRKAGYDLDDAQVRPYLALDRVLRDGAFFAAGKLYGLTFTERHDLPVYHPDVRVFEVTDEEAKPVGLFYADYFARDNKAGGAWMGSFVDQAGLLGTKPVIVNVCNFTQPAPGQPALLGFDDVTTLFHEFGHALHGLLSSVTYPILAGTNVPRDFVEFPSQFNEHWASEPTVFANYARHHVTGEPMPADLVSRIVKARRFNQGFATTEYVAAALLDMAWHTLAERDAPTDVTAFEQAALKRHAVDVALVPPRYRTSYFAHIWEGGYAGSYYAYLWSEVLAQDARQWFDEHGGLSREAGRRFRDMILSRGDTQEMASMYRAFRGRDPDVAALLAHRGLDA